MVLNKILFSLNMGDHEFDRETWKTNLNKRRLFVKDILTRKLAIGLTGDQVIDKFGQDRTEFTNNSWSYKVSSFKKGVTTDGNTKSSLILKFNELGIVTEAKMTFSKRC